ncbi:T9SS type A sorting domain-containing protein [Flavihumibacter petaseus]|uniref:Secretion system C-terminal sorting domain-containing protein n=1 Tax=Flavihumibacter petaseus NBRC 106054 TaxID=1220578 RepID=A0A0E9N036_9BACT|nr:T9SS type A sorting domain-containing protein [Flavihumibacter petaseus]GAO43209.1 hypothetical protein FPE01S_02_03130 [Flavihumibacter petaseus NBRC 106054]
MNFSKQILVLLGIFSVVTVSAQQVNDYRTNPTADVTVALNSATNWQIYTSPGGWITATTAPSLNTGFKTTTPFNTITVSAGDTWSHTTPLTFPASTNRGINFVIQGNIGTVSATLAFQNNTSTLVSIERSGSVDLANSLSTITFRNLSFIGTPSALSATITSSLTVLNNLTLNNATLTQNGSGRNMAVSGNVVFTGTSHLNLAGTSNILTLTSTSAFTNASSTSYIQMNGAARVVKPMTSGVAVTFPIGTTQYYLPATVTTGAGANKTVTVGVFTPATTDGTPGGPPFNATQLSWMVNAMWIIQTNMGGGGGNPGASGSSVSYQWPAALEGEHFSPLTNSQIGISSKASTVTTWSGAAQTTGNNSTNQLTLSNVVLGNATTSSFGIGNINSPLPLKTRDLVARWVGEEVKLSWTGEATATAAFFTVERSTELNGHYESIGDVPVSETGSIRYQFTDKAARQPTYYYRIRNTDENGKVTYTPSVKLQLATGRLVLEQFYPQPAKSQLNLNLVTEQSGNTEMFLVQSNGQTAWKQNMNLQKGRQTVQLNFPALSAGIYWLIIRKGEDQLQQTIIIQ